MSKAKQHKSAEQLSEMKSRFDAIKKLSKGRGKGLTSPLNGKNRSQRQSISSGFQSMGDLRTTHETQKLLAQVSRVW